MGRGKAIYEEEVRRICEYCLRGYSDEEIQRRLGRSETGLRSIRKIKEIRREFWVAQDFLIEKLEKLKSMQDSLPEQDVNRIIEIVNNMSKGRRPVYNKDTGEIRYEYFMEL
jgi:Zn-dependent M16 (insulinase) family peptidase